MRHSQGCWFLNTRQMGHYMNIFTVSPSFKLHPHLIIIFIDDCTYESIQIVGDIDGEGCQFSWTRRMKIAIGIARGLKYLHSELDPPFTISELNSNAVYLTEDFSPKVPLPFNQVSPNRVQLFL